MQRCLKPLSGGKDAEPLSVNAVSLSAFNSKGDRAQFLKAFINKGEVKILEGQSSAMLNTFAVANALLYLPETTKNIQVGDSVPLILIP